MLADSIAPGADSDSDGMADAFEYLYLSGLGANPGVDGEGDGMTNLDEYLNGTNPASATDSLRVTMYSTTAGGGSSFLAWTSNASRLYRIETRTDLHSAWTHDPTFGLITPDIGLGTSRTVTAISAAKRFYRVRAIRPLSPP